MAKQEKVTAEEHLDLGTSDGPIRRISRRIRVALLLPLAVYLRSRAVSSGIVVLTAFGLIVIHAVPENKFNIDEITLGLLVFVAIPALSQLVSSFKAGNVEVAFRDRAVNDQLVAFLDGIATKQQWTFYIPRPSEEPLGQAFKILTGMLLESSRGLLISKLKGWLASDNENHRWFAAEIVGYHRISELRRTVSKAPESQDLNKDWDTWELNCAWATSRIDENGYKMLRNFLFDTRSPENRKWILMAFEQMIAAQLDEPSNIEKFLHEFSDQYEKAKKEGAHKDIEADLKRFPNLRKLVDGGGSRSSHNEA